MSEIPTMQATFPQIPGVPGVPGVPVAPGVPGVPVAPGAPGVPGVPVAPVNTWEGNNTGISTLDTNQVQDPMAVVGYIASQKNYLKANFIPQTVASPKYKELKEKEMAKPEKDRKTTTAKLKTDGTAIEGEFEDLSDTFSQSRFRSFFWDEYKKIKDANYMQVVFAEARAESFIVKTFIPETYSTQQKTAIAERLRSRSQVYNDESHIFVLRKMSLIEYMTVSKQPSVPVLVPGNTDCSKPNGYILVNEKPHPASSGKSGSTFSLVFLKFDPVKYLPTKVKGPHDIGIPHAVNKDFTENAGIVSKAKEVVNAKEFKEKFPTQKLEKLGTRMDLTVNSGKSQDVIDQAKKAAVINYGEARDEKRFANLGLTKDDVEQLRSTKSRGRSQQLEFSAYLDKSNEAIRKFNSTVLNK